MTSTSYKQDGLPELVTINEDVSIFEALKIFNENLEKIYELEKRIYQEQIVVHTTTEEHKEVKLEDVDPTLKVASQTEKYIYSTIIPGLITGKIIKQEFTRVRNE